MNLLIGIAIYLFLGVLFYCYAEGLRVWVNRESAKRQEANYVPAYTLPRVAIICMWSFVVGALLYLKLTQKEE